MSEAAAVDRPASQLVRELMRGSVERPRQARDNDAWFRAEVEQGLKEANDPAVRRIAHEDAMASWDRMREQFAKKIEDRG